jgi:two-component system, response regulator PdtaR
VSRTIKTVVLIVEDEPLIRMNAAESIAEAGWHPVEAGDAVEALKILELEPSISVLFTDINMPGPMNGLDLAQRVYRFRPAIQIIVTSGKSAVSPARMPKNGIFLPKPYNLQDLINAVEAKLA